MTIVTGMPMRVNRWFLVSGLFALFCLSAYFFDQAFTPNPTSRLLPVVTWIEDGTWQIDRLKDWSQDKAKIGDHYYTDKAPLSSWLVLPFDWVYSKLVPSKPFSDLYSAFSIGNILCGVLPMLFLIVAIFFELEARGSKNAVWISTLPVFASPLAVYCGSFFGHLLAGSFILAAWLLLKKNRLPVWAGFLGGLTVLTEYPTAILVVGLGGCVWVQRKSIRDLALFVLGGLPAFIVLSTYNATLTGSPFKMTYSFVDDPAFQHMKTAYGFGLPSFTAIFSLLFGLWRGLLFYAPALILFAWSARKNPRFLLHPLSLAVIAFFVGIASYKMYWGGWAFGPRHLIPAMFLIFYEGTLWFETHSALHWPLISLSVFGILQAWLANATVVYMIPENFSVPVADLFIAHAREGKFNGNNLASLLWRAHPMIGDVLWLPLFFAAVLIWTSWYRTIQKTTAKIP